MKNVITLLILNIVILGIISGCAKGDKTDFNIVKHIAVVHGGTVEIKSVERKGTIITVKLPETV